MVAGAAKFRAAAALRSSRGRLARRQVGTCRPAGCEAIGAASPRLGPVGSALDQTTDLDVPGNYTNFGKRVVYLSAPGGQFTLGPNGPIPTLPPELECEGPNRVGAILR